MTAEGNMTPDESSIGVDRESIDHQSEPVNDSQARQVSLLIILLYALAPLFAVSSIIGILIAHTHIAKTAGTVYHSHMKWAITTFWLVFPAFAVALLVWFRTGLQWPAAVLAAVLIYRLSVHLWYWMTRKAITRIF